MKTLALYLPQYHEVDENNKWWGNGYTEWTAVKNAKPYFKGHIQPKIPLGDNYYDLSDPHAKTWKWQADLAKKYGIYGFVIYHYWFSTGKQLLQKPMEILLNHTEIDINYCVCWANESWTRTWYGLEKEVLMKQEYGDEIEWTHHFDYLLQFFQDKRYIKIDNKPVVHIYHSYEIDCLPQMLECWNMLARKEGYDGIFLIAGNTGGGIDYRTDLIDAYYNFEPSYSLIYKTNLVERACYGLSVKAKELYNGIFKAKVIERTINGVHFIDRMIREDRIKNKKVFPCVFPQWDNSPRRQYKGTVFLHTSPELFGKQIRRLLDSYSEAEYLYINAWNEWGEGAILEPDKEYRFAFLEELNNVVN